MPKPPKQAARRDRGAARPLAVLSGTSGRLHELLADWLSAASPEDIAVLDAYGALAPGSGAAPVPASLPVQDIVDLLGAGAAGGGGPVTGIGAVVPIVVDEHGRVSEAGAARSGEGALVPWGAGEPTAARHVSFRRDVAGTTAGVAAVSAAALDGFDAASAGDLGPAGTVSRALEHCGGRGLRTVLEPWWRVTLPAEVPAATAYGQSAARRGAGPRRWAERDELCPSRVLVVTGTLPGLGAGADGLGGLVEALACCPGTRVTLACQDGFAVARHAEHYQRQGIEVVAGPLDWLAWCGDRRYHYSHVVVSDEGLTTRLWPIARSTQPQAMAVLYSERLPLRALQGTVGATRGETGTQTLAEVLQARLLHQVEGIEAAWCCAASDAKLLSGLSPSTGVTVLGPPVVAPVPGKGFSDRDGVVVVAADAYDLVADAEESALQYLERLVPAWRRRDMSLRARVVADWPTPGLVAAAARSGAEIVPSGGNLAAVLATARLVVGPAAHGTSACSWVPAAVAACTPWLCSASAMSGTFLEPLADLGALEGTAAMTSRGWALLTDEGEWSEVAAALGERRDAMAADRGHALLGAITAAGLEPPLAPRWPEHRWSARPVVARPQPALRPPSVADPPAVFVADSLSEDERYELWHARRGPGNAEVVAAIAAEALAAAYQPTISVLMPVCDTEPWMLEAAVASVADQPYPNWELCMADDASVRPETLAAIEAAQRRDARVKLTRLERRSGISAATNAALALAGGEFVAFLDHDDVLKPHALAQVVRWLDADPDLDMLYSDEDKLTPAGRFTEARWKPDWSPNLLLCQNYVCHFLVLRRELLERMGGLRSEYDGSQDYDLVLRVAEATDRIAHVPDSLYSWRIHERSAALAGDAKPWAWLAAQRALGDYLARREAAGETGGWTEEGAWFDVHRTRFRRSGEPKVSIVIPTRNGRHLLGRCIESVISKSVYDNYELVVVDNQSDDPETLEYLATLPGRVVGYPHEFNYSRQLNLAVAAVECDLLVFLNNDTVVMTTDWLDRLIEQAMRPEVGAVGPRLLLPDGRVQHEGILVGAWRGHANSVEWGNWWRMGDLARDVTAVTGACMATRPGVFRRLGGYDERLRVAYNDVDYCMRLHQAGYQVVYEPDAALFHAEGSTRGTVEDPHDAPLFNDRWRPRSSCDPYYNPNLNRNRLLFRVEP